MMNRDTISTILSVVNIIFLGFFLILSWQMSSSPDTITVEVRRTDLYENSDINAPHFFCELAGVFCSVGDTAVFPGEGDSMEPTMQSGKLYECIRTSNYNLNDVIVFYKGGSLVAHRAIGKNEDGSFITKGDNDTLYTMINVSQDPWHVYNNEILCKILGEVEAVE